MDARNLAAFVANAVMQIFYVQLCVNVLETARDNTKKVIISIAFFLVDTLCVYFKMISYFINDVIFD